MIYFTHILRYVLGALSPLVLLPGSEADHSSLSNAEVRNVWRYNSAPIRLHDVVLS
jgi:hypothetical protein